MVPHAAPLQPAPVTVQLTAIFEVPVTVAVNCCVLPTDTVALLGFTCTAAPVALETFRVAALLVVLPALLRTRTLKRAPLSAAVAGGVV
jgi:hypothetical protein